MINVSIAVPIHWLSCYSNLDFNNYDDNKYALQYNYMNIFFT